MKSRFFGQHECRQTMCVGERIILKWNTCKLYYSTVHSALVCTQKDWRDRNSISEKEKRGGKKIFLLSFLSPNFLVIFISFYWLILTQFLLFFFLSLWALLLFSLIFHYFVMVMAISLHYFVMVMAIAIVRAQYPKPSGGTLKITFDLFVPRLVHQQKWQKLP